MGREEVRGGEVVRRGGGEEWGREEVRNGEGGGV